MKNAVRRIFLRTTLKVELIIYLVPVPVLVYFVLYAFRYAGAHPLPFLGTVLAASTVALGSGALLRWLWLRPMTTAMAAAAAGTAGAALLARGARAAHLLPAREGLSVFLRWLISPALFITLPFALAGAMSPVEAISNTVFTGITGLVSIPLVFHICEGETARFFMAAREAGGELPPSPLRIGITLRLVTTLLLVIAYPAGLFLYVIILSNIGYLDLHTIPVGFGLLIFCSILLSVVTALLFSRSVGASLRAVNASLEAAARGDLTARLAPRGRDEIGELTGHFNSVTAALGASVRSVRDSARSLARWVSDISSASRALAEASAGQQSSAESVRVTTESFSATLQSMTQRITSHERTVAQSASAVEQLSVGVVAVARSAGAVRETVGEHVAAMEQGRAKIRSSIDQTLGMNQSLASVSSAVRGIDERFRRIAETLAILQDISGQTNILAMNAAIEAAHAGSAGRGFAIVAAEVRGLAERSTQFVKEIGSLMSDIGRGIGQAVQAAQAGERISADGRRAAEEAGRAVEAIAESMKRIGSLVGEIDRTTGEQAAAASNAQSGMDRLREFSRALSQEVEGQAEASRKIAVAVTGIGDGTLRNTSASRELAELGAALRAKSEELATAVARFKIGDEGGTGGGSP
jgi:methyl-accepting chemotaxis protein